MGQPREAASGATLIAAVRGGIGATRRSIEAVRWYVATVMGDNDYQRYVAHQAARHPGIPPCSERDYWRNRHDAQEADPQGRCC